MAGKEITLCSNIPSLPSTCLARETKYTNVSLLKSHLQKCIRRCHVDRAVKTARHLAQLDLIQLLRRLPIILAEDSMLHWRHYPILIWLLAAVSKQYQPPRCMLDWVFGLVASVATVRKHECFSGEVDGSVKLGPVQTSFTGPVSDGQAFLYSIQLRRGFGGMPGDLK